MYTYLYCTVLQINDDDLLMVSCYAKVHNRKDCSCYHQACWQGESLHFQQGHYVQPFYIFLQNLFCKARCCFISFSFAFDEVILYLSCLFQSLLIQKVNLKKTALFISFPIAGTFHFCSFLVKDISSGTADSSSSNIWNKTAATCLQTPPFPAGH